MSRSLSTLLHVILISLALLLVACSDSDEKKKFTTVPDLRSKALPTPHGLTAVAADGEVTLSWPVNTDADGYNLYWSTNDEVDKSIDTKISIAGDLVEYRHSSLNNRTTYYYVYTIETERGESIESNPIYVTPQINTDVVPQQLVVQPGNQRITLTWEPPPVAGSISHYSVYWNTTGHVSTADNQTTVSAPPAVHSELNNGSQYYYVVTAVMTDGAETSPSAEATTSPRLPPLPAPRSIKLTSGTNQASIEWGEVEGATTYHLYWNTSGDVTSLDQRINDVNSPFIHDGLRNNTRYYYRVSAEHSEKESALSAQVAAYPLASPPQTPQNLTAVAGVEHVTFAWAPVSGATSYNLYWRRDGLQHVISNINESVEEIYVYTHSGLNGGIPITYSVTAVSNGVESSSSAEATVTPLLSPPSSPANFSIRAGDGQVTLSWALVEDAVSYNIYWNTTGQFDEQYSLISGVTLPYTHIGLSNGTTYYYVITAVSDSGESEYSAFVTVSPQKPQLPAPVLNSTEASDGTVTLNWQPIHRASSYNLYWSTEPGFSIENGILITDVQTPFQHHDLRNGTAYYYLLTAVNAAGESSPSSPIAVTPISTTATPPIFTSVDKVIHSENITLVMALTAEGSTGGAVNYFVSGGEDQGLFAIDSKTGVLSFNTKPDYESPLDENSDNVYELTVKAIGDNGVSALQQLMVTVTNVNDNAPVFTSESSAIVAEINSSVLTVSAQDVDDNPITFSIAGGSDAEQFQIEPTTGVLHFLSAPDFENPADNDGDNVYLVDINVSDSVHTLKQAIIVTVSNANDPPFITSPSDVSTNENAVAVSIVNATDVDDNTMIYNISGGADQAYFVIDNDSGELQFITAPDFENPTDSDADNNYVVVVSVTDGEYTAEQTLTVTVLNEFVKWGPDDWSQNSYGLYFFNGVSAAPYDLSYVQPIRRAAFDSENYFHAEASSTRTTSSIRIRAWGEIYWTNSLFSHPDSRASSWINANYLGEFTIEDAKSSVDTIVTVGGNRPEGSSYLVVIDSSPLHPSSREWPEEGGWWGWLLDNSLLAGPNQMSFESGITHYVYIYAIPGVCVSTSCFPETSDYSVDSSTLPDSGTLLFEDYVDVHFE